jgi:alpha-amylase
MANRNVALSLLRRSFLLACCLASCAPSASSSDADSGTFSLATNDGTYTLDSSVSNENSSLNYEIFVRSFYDSDGNGVGDFAGVAAKADYLKSLGVGTVWLMPIQPSPSYHGYDVSNYYDVNSEFGDMASFQSMVTTLKAKGINVIIDMVLNHSSTRNSWFTQSFSDYVAGDTSSTSKADWYIWSENSGTNMHSYQGYYYEGDFDAGMPDFNFKSAGVQAEFKKILNFWLDKGVSGFRLDAVRYYYQGSTSENVKALNQLVDDVSATHPGTYFVGENWTTGSDYYAYYASKINSFFSFEESNATATGTTILSYAKGYANGDDFSSAIETSQSQVKALNSTSYNSFFLSNHDMDRSSNSFSGNNAKMAASVTYLLPGTPYIYYGEEIGLKGVRGSNDNSDVLRRLPMIWSQSDKTGECKFPESDKSYLSSHVDQVKEGATDLLAEPTSLINHYRKVGNVRAKYSFIRDATFKAIPTKSRYLCAYSLTGNGQTIVVVHNSGKTNQELDVSSYANTLLDSIETTQAIPTLNEGKLRLGAYSSVVLANR